MTAPTIDLSQYSGQKVFVQFDNDETDVQKGTVTSASSQGILFKAYGRSNVDLIPAARINHIELQPSDEELKPRRVNPVTVKNVKRHLVDWHGYKLAEINGMEAEAALLFHENAFGDHAEYGHFHAEPSVKEDKTTEAATSE